MIGHFTDGRRRRGQRPPHAKLALPLGEAPKPQGHRRVHVRERRSCAFRRIPRSRRSTASSRSPRTSVRARDLTVDVLGGPAKLAIASADGRVRVGGSGTANLASLRREFDGAVLPIACRGPPTGRSPSTCGPEQSTWVLESPMKGAIVDLPAPLGKAAGDAMPLRIERRERHGAGRTKIIVDSRPTAGHRSWSPIASAARRRAARPSIARCSRSGAPPDRPDAARAERPGRLGARRACRVSTSTTGSRCGRARRPPSAPAADAMPPRSPASISMSARSTRSGAGSTTSRSSRAAVGARLEARSARPRGRRHGDLVGAAAASAPNGRIVARLARFAMPGPRPSCRTWSSDGQGGRRPRRRAVTRTRGPRSTSPPIRFVSKGRDLGRLELVAQPQRRRLADREAGARQRRRAHRRQRRVARRRRDSSRRSSTSRSTRKDAGAFLARFGYPDALQGAPTQDRRPARVGRRAQRIRLSDAHRHASRSTSGPGRFTKIEPGHRQAARRAVAAVAAAADHARFPRRVQRGLRVRRHHGQRAHRRTA